MKNNKKKEKEIELKKKNRLKESGSMDVLGYLNKPFTSDSKPNKNNNSSTVDALPKGAIMKHKQTYTEV